MHRSRLSMLVIFAAAAACSTRDDAKGTTDDSLSKDPTLVAKLEAGRQTPQALPAACGTVAVGAQPSEANRAQSDELTRRATCRIFLAPPLSLPQEPEEEPVA